MQDFSPSCVSVSITEEIQELGHGVGFVQEPGVELVPWLQRMKMKHNLTPTKGHMGSDVSGHSAARTNRKALTNKVSSLPFFFEWSSHRECMMNVNNYEPRKEQTFVQFEGCP